jgi:heptose I phosphotransferase
VPADDGTMWLDGRFGSQLQRAGLLGFDRVMAVQRGRCLRELQKRENWHLPAAATPQNHRGLYLKKHRVRTWTSRLRALLRLGPGRSAASVEAQNCTRLAAEGIDVMHVVAYGEKLHADGLLESFLLTEELHDYADLTQFLRRRFPPRPLGHSVARDRDLDRLIRRIAQVARRFHQAGYNHRDFYCCHFFVKEEGPGEFGIRIIDLHRVQRRRFLRRRWLVKDLSQLAWSLPRDRVGCTQKMAFMRYYLGVKKLRPSHKRFIRRVLLKQQILERRLGIEP